MQREGREGSGGPWRPQSCVFGLPAPAASLARRSRSRYIGAMLLYTPRRRAPLVDYGILIPVAPGKSDRILAALRAHPVLGRREAEWHLDRDDTTMGRVDLLRAHSPRYVDELLSDRLERAILRAYELIDEAGRPNRYDPSRAVRPLTELLDGALENAAGTYQCGRVALARGFCFYLGGGAHHAHADFGHGFCPINDSVIALRRLQAEGHIRTAWVIDVDAHKGDGTAAITRDDPSIVTLSVHMARGWPLDGEERRSDGSPNPSFIPSDIDVGMEEGDDASYVPRLAEALRELASRPRPDLALVLDGADPYEKDGLPSTRLLRLTAAQMLERDLMIDGFLRERSIPAAFLMAGGYGEHAWEVYPPFLQEVLPRSLRG
jgi:acetoin utilization deacetylase AcuC-like enzyme